MGKLNKRKRTRAKQEREIFTVNAPRREVKQLRKHRQTYLRAEEYRATEDARYLNSNVKAWLAHQYPEDYGYWKRYTEDDRLVSKASDLPICNVRVFPNWGFMPRILPRQGMDRFKGQAIWDWLVSGARRLELEEYIGEYTHYAEFVTRLALLQKGKWLHFGRHSKVWPERYNTAFEPENKLQISFTLQQHYTASGPLSQITYGQIQEEIEQDDAWAFASSLHQATVKSDGGKSRGSYEMKYEPQSLPVFRYKSQMAKAREILWDRESEWDYEKEVPASMTKFMLDQGVVECSEGKQRYTWPAWEHRDSWVDPIKNDGYEPESMELDYSDDEVSVTSEFSHNYEEYPDVFRDEKGNIVELPPKPKQKSILELLKDDYPNGYSPFTPEEEAENAANINDMLVAMVKRNETARSEDGERSKNDEIQVDSVEADSDKETQEAQEVQHVAEGVEAIDIKDTEASDGYEANDGYGEKKSIKRARLRI